MNRIAFSIAFPLCIAALAGAAHAAETTIDVSATILATCALRNTPTALGFGTVDATSKTAVTATTEIQYSCTRGTSVRFSGPDGTIRNEGDNATLNRNLIRTGGAETLAYDVSWRQPSGTGAGHSDGNIVRVPLTATLAAAAFQDAAAGSYSDPGLKFTIMP